MEFEKRSKINLIPWIIALGLIVTIVAVATEVKASAFVPVAEGSRIEVGSPSLTPVGIAWQLTGIQVSGTKVTWTPKTSGRYTIVSVVSGNDASATVWAEAGQVRTDTISFSQPIDALNFESVNVVIVED